MLTKTDVIRSFEGLPENVSAEQLIEKKLFLKRIDKGLEQAKNNEITIITLKHQSEDLGKLI